MPTLKRKNANGVFEYLQVTGQDVLSIENKIDGIVSPEMFGAKGNAKYYNPTDRNWYQDSALTLLATDDTAAFQQAFDTGKMVLVAYKNYLVDPSVGIMFKTTGTRRVIGVGDSRSLLVCKPVGGSVIKRQYTPGVANDYIQDIWIEGIGIIFSHPLVAQSSNYVQIGFDFRHITRSTIQECYAGNFNRGNLNKPKENTADMIQGYGIVFGTASASAVDYCGGEVNSAIRCSVWGAFKGIVVDDLTLTPTSAAYVTYIENCDIQAVQHGIVQEEQWTAGMTWRDNAVQNVMHQNNNTDPSYIYRIEGNRNQLDGGYVEIYLANEPTYMVYLGSLSHDNTIGTFRLGGTGNATFTDNGTNNNIKRYTANVEWEEGAVKRLRKGIKFGSGTDILNNYTLGTFTPSIYGATSGDGVGSVTYSVQQGMYTRIGNIVIGSLTLTWSASSGMTGGIRIKGLPFTAKNVSNGRQSAAVWYSGMTASTDIMALIYQNTSEIRLYSALNNGTSAQLNVETDGADLTISFMYLTD